MRPPCALARVIGQSEAEVFRKVVGMRRHVQDYMSAIDLSFPEVSRQGSFSCTFWAETRNF